MKDQFVDRLNVVFLSIQFNFVVAVACQTVIPVFPTNENRNLIFSLVDDVVAMDQAAL